MNVNYRKIRAVTASLALMVAAAGPAQAERYGQSGAVYDYATVVNVEPIVRLVTVTTPVRECWDERREYAVDNRRGSSGGATLFGAILGGVLGHQFGSGSGNDAATAAGALLGAAIGSDAARRAPRDYERETYSRPVRRCQTNYTSTEEERVDGYNVTYRYHGQKYRTRMPYDPGERLRIRVDVRPAE
ncbi:MAG: glycine zipper 2TM domain-containing protein [Woeseia sp.]|nr:glycine zipper 2TM domain-containing protein [Woeseia sp.]